MTKLYELAEAFEDVLDKLNNLEDDEDTQEIATHLETIQADIKVKIEGCLKIHAEYTADSRRCKEEADRLRSLAGSSKRKADWLKNYVYDTMTRLGIDHTMAGVFDVRVAKGPPVVEITVPKDIPEEYYNTPEPVLDKRRILEAEKEGIEVPGVEVRQNTHLRIR
tara:strand:- start:9179 stop:9673 length:495 start_codon:yes stop_codon:yes gene_type:complete